MGPALCLLGPLEVRAADGSRVPVGGTRPRELLAMLLVHHGTPVSDDRLVHALWGEAPQAGAAATLRSHVGRVRRLLEEADVPATLERRSGGYVLDVASEQVDAARFETLLGQGRAAAAAGRPHDAVRLLGDALALWRGEVLSDLGPPTFAVAIAADLDEKRLLTHEAWFDARLAAGAHVDVVPALQALVELHPFRERFAAQLVLALYRSGRQADALAAAATTRARLADELGLDPGAELQELESRVLRQDAALHVAPAAGTTAGPAPGTTTLVERDGEIAVLVDAVGAAAAGRGRCVAVAGDAGVGKTALVRAAVDGTAVRRLRGQCDPLSTPRPYGPLRDVAGAAGVTVWDRGDEVVLSEVCDEVVSALVTEPTVLVVEDLHWVDTASVEVLRFLARRCATLQLSIVVTYRDHEVGPQHPARPLLGDLARLEHAGALHLSGLSPDGVATLLGDAPLDVASVHALTGGNPFFVIEVGSEPDRPLPVSVRDALLDRTATLSADDLHLLQLAALSPDRLDDAVLRALGVDVPTLHRLEATGLLALDGPGLAYRHELARQAVAGTIPPAGVPGLHARMLDALERGGCREPALLTHHAVAAHDASRAFTHAVAAAEVAARSAAHTDAVAFYEVALEHQHDAAPAERARLLQLLSMEQYLTSRLDEAMDTVGATIELWERAGDGGGLASAYDTSAIFAYYDARRAAAESYADRATEVATASGLPAPLGAARATRGFLGFLRGELDLARACAAEASEAADRTDDRMLRVRAEIVATLAALAADVPAVRTDLLALIRDARSEGWDEVASTGFSQLVALDVEHGRIALAEQVLEDSIPYTFRRDIPICRHWQTAVRARVHLGHGQWDDALVDAADVIETRGMEVARLWPYLITGLVPVRRGIAVDHAPPLDHAWGIATSIDEPIRRLSALAVLAEVMWTTGVVDARVVEHAAADLARLADAPGAHWAAGDLAVWLRRLDLLHDVPPGLPEPHTALLDGRRADAQVWWDAHDQPFHAALALATSTDAAERASGVERLVAAGAEGTARAVSRRTPDASTVRP